MFEFIYKERIKFLSLFFFYISSFATLAFSQSISISKNSYGTPGLIDMPIAASFNDGELSFSSSNFGTEVRNTLSFQALPRVNGSFRYSGLGDKKEGFFYKSGYTTWDRSFDLRIDVRKETNLFPSLTLGFLDFIGTGIYSSEYLVTTKTFGKKIRGTLGLGWGRLGTANVVSKNGSRSGSSGGSGLSLGGTLKTGHYFQGNVGAFGGIEVMPVGENLKLNLEVSSDDYSASYYTKRAKSDVNLGASYEINKNFSFSSYYLRGRELGLQMNISINPESTSSGDFLEKMPEPFYSIPIKFEKGDISYVDKLKKELKKLKIKVKATKEEKNEFIVIIENYHYSSNIKAIGRTLRALSKFVPLSMTKLSIIITRFDIPISKVTVNRHELAFIVDAPNAELISSKIININDSKPYIFDAKKIKNNSYSDFSITPFYRLHLFDPDKPFYYDLGPDLNLNINPRSGLYLSGKLEYSYLSNFDEIWRGPKGTLPYVRSDLRNYLTEKGPRLRDLKAESFFKMSDKIYGRFSMGYFEPMYAGISAEILRSSIDSKLSFGAELNYIKAREYKQRLGFRDLKGLSKLNGHLSANWDTEYKNYIAKLDVGKYLAGDKGGTFTLMRKWTNGWNVGGFFTLTDATFEEYGEGSFDKGFFIRVPFHPIVPYDTRYGITELIRPIQGDGGARVHVDNRLFDVLLDHSRNFNKKSWATLWR